MSTVPARELLKPKRHPRSSRGRQLPHLERTLAYYEENADTYFQSTRPLSMKSQLKRFAKSITRGGTVLDIGCGSGRDLTALQAAGFVPIGLEISPTLAAMAEKHSGCAVTVGDMRDPPFIDSTFDGIWAAASLLHLQRAEVAGVLVRLRRLLIPGGRLFASVKSGAGEERSSDGRWFTYFQPKEWCELLATSGFSEIEIERDEGRKGRTRSPEGWIQSFASAS